jgi:hypothetical protein
MDQYGGLTTILVVVGSIAFLGAIAWQARPKTVSTADLRGTEVAIAAASHTTNAADVIIPEGEPPAGGPHFPTPLTAKKYTDPVQDGNAIHSLEHGMIWITYNRDMVSDSDLKTLENIQSNNSRDVILSPRPENRIAIGVVSWGRLLRLDKPDEKAITDFINVNRDRSPEPGVR